ncbi:hypothetical protein FPV67DRAFT_1650884 [Lyophyllum atratum]|nr:hypothetical protein FPV67DRAFT_1650884 [Lyophyllum atratum]
MNRRAPMPVVDQVVLTTIPNELYIEVFDYIAYSTDLSQRDRTQILSNLALVCCLFSEIAAPRIFRSLHISGSTNVVEGSESKKNNASLCRAIVEGNESAVRLGSHVRVCSLTHWENDSGLLWVDPNSLNIYERALSRLSNLQSLRVNRVDIGKALLEAICGLKTLRSLSVTFSSFCDDITEDFLRNMPSLMLRELSITWSRFNIESLMRHAGVFRRIINATCLESLSSNRWEITEAILLQTGESTLKKLDLLNAQPHPALWDVLSQFRFLKTLRIGSLALRIGETIPTVAASSIPQLQNLSCPSSMLHLVAGRPLTSIEVLQPQFPPPGEIPEPSIGFPELALLQQSSASIFHLRIPSKFYLLSPFFESFPEIRHLHIDFTYTEKRRMSAEVNSLITKWPPAHSIRSFRLIGTRKKEQSLLVLITRAFPSVRRVMFSYDVEWCREADDDSWVRINLPMEESYRDIHPIRAAFAMAAAMQAAFH